MAKSQFQSSESLQVRFPAFVDSTGTYLISGPPTETALLTVSKPDGMGGRLVSTVSLNWDSDVHMWWIDLAALLPANAGEWRFKAVSSIPTAFPQWKVLHVADYVDNLDGSVEQARVAAELASSIAGEMRTVQFGRWKIDGTQLVFYQDDGVTEFMRFDLKDSTGAPSATRIFERTPV